MIPSKNEWMDALITRHGLDLHERFSSATVAICGLGGLGSNIAIALARAGIGKLLLIDFDHVDITNLHRQQYKANQIGLYKADALAENLLEMSHFFSEIFTCTEVGSGKDRPYIFQRAMEHLQTERRTTAVVEDAYHAIRTAKQDGFLVVAVYDSHESRQQELLRLADVFLSDYFDLTSFWKFVSAE